MFALEERASCPVCGAGGAANVLTAPFDRDPIRTYLEDFYEGSIDPDRLAGSTYELRRCTRCDLVYQRWVPDAETLAYVYGTAAKADPAEVARSRGLDTRLMYVDTVEKVVRYFGGKPDRVKVLDFGAGTGLWLRVASALGCDATGAEFDEELVERLRRDGHRAVSIDELGSGEFHFVNTEQVFEHLIDPRETVLRLAEVLRPGGLLRISVPNGTDIARRLEVGDWAAPKGSADSLNPVAPLEHVNCFNNASIRALAAEAGLVPFTFPFRTELHQLARIRFAVSSVAHHLRPPSGTMQYFRRPDAAEPPGVPARRATPTS